MLVGVGIGLAVMFLLRRRNNDQAKYIEAIHNNLSERMDQVTQQMDRRLTDNVKAINESKSFIAGQLNTSERTAREVSSSLGRLEQTTKHLQKTNEDISSFQNMLGHPKIRGGFGELLLGNLLADVLPQDRYKLQYNFAGSGELADAVILLQDGYIVAVDAKFPLANYQMMVKEENEEKKEALRKVFIRDIKKHVKDIADKYISPRHKTLDYAFMYIPVEAVYYETMVHDPAGNTLWEYCLSNKVIAVSPNSFLAYLHTVLVGLRGMKVEEQAKDILQHLGQVRSDFSRFAKDFATIGTHLNNVKNRYDDSARWLDKFASRLDQIETGGTSELEEGEEEGNIENRNQENGA